MSDSRACLGTMVAVAMVAMVACGGDDDGGNGGGANARCRQSAGSRRVAYPNPAPLGIALAIADVNGDGLPDLITAAGSDSIAVHSGLGDGSFCGGEIFAGVGSNRAIVADIDDDGTSDLVTSSRREVFLQLNAGRGEFLAPTVIDIALAPSGSIEDLEVDDLNGDGLPDLLTANGDTGDLGILINIGDGDFDVRSRNVDVDRAAIVAVGDLNQDGIPDLVVGGSVSEDDLPIWRTLLGTGSGDFVEDQLIEFPRALLLELADLNGDGALDLVAARDQDLYFAFGLGDGQFDSVQTLQVASAVDPALPSGSLTGLLVEDLDGDGRNDLITVVRSGTSSGTATVHLGSGDGTFSAGQIFDVPDPFPFAGADLNKDGFVDLIIGDAPSGSVWLGSEKTTLSPRRSVPRYGVGSGPNRVVLVDLNRDSVLDLATANSESGNVATLIGRGDGSFEEAEFIALGTADGSPADIATADFNTDGIPDLVTADQDTDSVTVLLGLGDARFDPGRIFEVGNAPIRVATADLDVDGNTDVLTMNVGDCTGSSQLFSKTMDRAQGSIQEVGSCGISILLGNGNGSFETANPVPIGPGVIPSDVAVSDLNRDGLPDLAVMLRFGGPVFSPAPLVVFFGVGDGSFSDGSTTRLGSGSGGAAISIVDLNQDGFPDIVAANRGFGGGICSSGCPESGISILLNLGNSLMHAEEIQLNVIQPVDIVVGLFDADDIPDIAMLEEKGALSVRLGIGDGTFERQQGFQTDASPASIVAGDLNGDGVPDIVTANFDANDVSVLLGERVEE